MRMKWPNPQVSESALQRAMAARLAARVAEANILHRDGALEDAEAIYCDVLATQPNHADALHFLGVVRAKQSRLDEAVELIKQSLMQVPGYTDAWNNLGNLHKMREELSQARACYAKVLAKQPLHRDARNNLAVVELAVGEVDAARELYVGLLSEGNPPDFMLHGFAMLLVEHPRNRADLEKAALCFAELVKRDPANRPARRNLGMLLYLLDRREEAAQVYRDWLAIDPADPIAAHMLAACGGSDVPQRAADDYVRNTFDAFAASFDQVLVDRLGYVAPQRLHAALTQHLGDPARRLVILDAGCGTGLCAPLFREHASLLVGVDLSGGMVERAAARGYDQLEVAELGAFLERQFEAWDVVLSADTLVYFGELCAVLASAGRALRPGGLLGFTLEALDDGADVVRLSLSGRYQHSRRHVEAAVAAAGCELVALFSESLRKEAGQPVPGWVVVARRPC